MRGFAELEQLMFYWSTVFGAIRFAWKMRFAWEGLVNFGERLGMAQNLRCLYAWKTAQSSGLHWALARSTRKLHVMCFCKTARGWSLAISDSVHRGTKSIRISQKRKRCCSTFLASFANPLLLAMLQCSQNSAQGSLESMDPMPEVEGSPETLAECLSTECPVPVEAGLPARVPWPKVGWSRVLGHFASKLCAFRLSLWVISRLLWRHWLRMSLDLVFLRCHMQCAQQEYLEAGWFNINKPRLLQVDSNSAESRYLGSGHQQTWLAEDTAISEDSLRCCHLEDGRD